VSGQKKTNKVGRPKLPKGHAKGKIVPVRLNDDEVKLFAKAAKASEHKTLSSWIRHTLREAANK
jgi:uncharacterized protein (DUF1778 family)